MLLAMVKEARTGSLSLEEKKMEKNEIQNKLEEYIIPYSSSSAQRFFTNKNFLLFSLAFSLFYLQKSQNGKIHRTNDEKLNPCVILDV